MELQYNTDKSRQMFWCVLYNTISTQYLTNTFGELLLESGNAFGFCGLSGSEKQSIKSQTIHSKTKRPGDRVSVNYFEFLQKISRVDIAPLTQNSSDFEDFETGNQSLQTSCLLESLSRTWKCFLAL